MSLKNVNSFTKAKLKGCWVLWPCSSTIVDNCHILPLNKAARAIFVNSCLSVLLWALKYITCNSHILNCSKIDVA